MKLPASPTSDSKIHKTPLDAPAMNIDKYTENLKLASIFSVPAYKHQHYTTILGSSLYHQRQHVLLVLLLILLPIHSYGNWGGRVTPVYKKMQHLNISAYLTFNHIIDISDIPFMCSKVAFPLQRTLLKLDLMQIFIFNTLPFQWPIWLTFYEFQLWRDFKCEQLDSGPRIFFSQYGDS